jgi:cellobiose epimerase
LAVVLVVWFCHKLGWGMRNLFVLCLFLGLFQPSHAQVKSDRLNAIADRLAVLLAKGMSFWKSHGLDAANGGFYGTLNSQGASINPTNKSLILETRHLWTLASFYARREATDSVKAMTDNLYGFITEKMLNTQSGEVYNGVTANGTVTDTSHPLYMDGFAVYALSRYAITFKKTEAANLALKLFQAMEKYHDADFGGYDEKPQPALLEYRNAGGVKCTNTHLHLMEAFTTLYEATGDASVKTRLMELVNIMVTKIRQPSGYNNAEFTANWTPVAPANVSYGHDLESAWLLMETAQVLGIPNDTAISNCAKQIGMLSSQQGWHTAGGYYASGPVAGNASVTTKIWWVQAEALEGNWWLYKLTNDTTYINRLEGTLNWIETYQMAPSGEWYQNLNTNGMVTGTTNMSDAWKSSYHSMRALMNTEDWIRGKVAISNHALSRPNRRSLFSNRRNPIVNVNVIGVTLRPKYSRPDGYFFGGQK